MKRSGFSIIEVMLALAVISIAMTGFLSLAASNVAAGKQTEQRYLGLELAKEGIEVVRNMRDTNWLIGCSYPGAADCRQWNSGLAQDKTYTAVPIFEYPDNKWSLSFVNTNIDACRDQGTCPVYKSEDFIYSGKNIGAKTEYSRLVEINQICTVTNECGGDGICVSGESCNFGVMGLQVLSHVRWLSRGQVRSINLEERLYNWK